MTEPNSTATVAHVLTLQALIRRRMDERGWSYGDLAHRTGDELTRGRWQQLGSGTRMKAFPEPETLGLIAHALEVDETAVLLAAARSLGLQVRTRMSDFAQMLPTGTDQLSPDMQTAILAIIRAAVVESLAREADDEQATDEQAIPAQTRRSASPVLEWSKPGRNATRRTGEDHA